MINQSNIKLIRLSKSIISDSEKQAVIEVLNNEYLGMGENVKNFEKKLSFFFNRPVACVSSGTAALQLALQACGIGKDDEVLVQSITYVASFQAISATGAKPVACDIEINSLNISLEDAKKRITSKTKAIMPVHYAGSLGDYEEIYNFAKEYDLRVIEDAAHAFGTTRNGKLAGSFGDIICFSFDGIKNITCGEGGCIVSEDHKVIEKVRDARLLGVEKDTENRFGGKRSWDFEVNNQGWRYHMSNLMASIGISQLERFPFFAKKRRSIAKFYDEKLKGNSLITPFERDYDEIVPHIYPVLLSRLIDRQKLQEFLNNKNIQTGIHYKPNHLLSYYGHGNQVSLKNTDALYQRIITLPLHPEVSFEDVIYIVEALNEYLSEN